MHIPICERANTHTHIHITRPVEDAEFCVKRHGVEESGEGVCLSHATQPGTSDNVFWITVAQAQETEGQSAVMSCFLSHTDQTVPRLDTVSPMSCRASLHSTS